MPDPFFQKSSLKKRKRPSTTPNGHSASYKKKSKTGVTSSKGKARKDENEMDEDNTVGGGIFDDIDLRGSDVDEGGSDLNGEDSNETPAEKRLRLAKLYLEEVKQGLGEHFRLMLAWSYVMLTVFSYQLGTVIMMQQRLIESSSSRDYKRMW